MSYTELMLYDGDRSGAEMLRNLSNILLLVCSDSCVSDKVPCERVSMYATTDCVLISAAVLRKQLLRKHALSLRSTVCDQSCDL